MCASLIPAPPGGYALDAQWHDDFHHALYALLTGEREGFLMDFGALADLSSPSREGFVFDWKYSRYRRRHYGSSSKDRPGEQFVGFIQNHDQIANTSRGKRLASLVSEGQQKLAAVLTLCSPFLPLAIHGGRVRRDCAFFLLHQLRGCRSRRRPCARGEKRTGVALLGKRVCRSAGCEHFRALQAGLVEARRFSSRGDSAPLPRSDFSAQAASQPGATAARTSPKSSLMSRSKYLRYERADPSGSAALLVCNFSARAQSIPRRRSSVWASHCESEARCFAGQTDTLTAGCWHSSTPCQSLNRFRRLSRSPMLSS